MRKKTKIALFITDNLIWFILLIMVLISGFLTPVFFRSTNLLNIIYHSSVLGMLVLAQALCLISGHFDLSIESTLAFAPTIGVLMMLRWFPGFNPILAIIVTLLTGCIVGFINGFFVTKLKINPFLQTLAMLIIMRGIVLYLVPISVYGLPSQYTALGFLKIGPIPLASIVFVLVYIVMHLVLRGKPFGRYLYAVGGNKIAAFISGIDVNRIILSTFVLSGLFASIGGLFVAGRLNAITNVMGEGMVFMAFAGAVIGGVSLHGGIGKIPGVIGGVLLLGVIDNVLNLKDINPYIIYATKGVLVFIAILLDQTKINARNWIIKQEDLFFYKIKKQHIFDNK